METPNLPAICALRPAWNKGRLVGQKRPLKPKHVWAIRVRLELAKKHRDLALVNMAIGLGASAYGPHSLRRTKVTQIYKKTGNLRAVQLLLGHTKMDSTVRYLGVEHEDALAIAEAIEI